MPTILLACGRDRELLPGPTTEVRDLRTFPSNLANLIGYTLRKLKKSVRPELSIPKGLWDLDLNYKEGPDLSFPVDRSAESLLVDINNTKERNVIVGIVYEFIDHTTQNLIEFLSDLDQVLEKITAKNKLVF